MKIYSLVFILFFLSANRCKPNSSKNLDEDLTPVLTESAAIQKAESVWLSIYGNKIYKKKPFYAIESEDKRAWVVVGTQHKQKGGVPEIIIRKSDGEVLKVFFSK